MSEARHLRLAWGGATDQGRVRAVNQDAMYADRGLFVVADGMGGHQGGEVAANIAVRTVAGDPHETCEQLREAVENANTAVHETAIARPELHGMGTTLTAIAVVTDEGGPHFGLVNVGDSRIYRQRGGVLHQLTYDHSYVAELIRRGDLNEIEAANHPYRNMLTRAIGVHAEVEVDEWEVEPEAGDRYVLCSDGLTNEVTDDEINAVLNQNPEVSEAARALVQLANLNGGRDNSTVLIVDVRIDAETTPNAAPVVAAAAVDDEAPSPEAEGEGSTEPDGTVEDEDGEPSELDADTDADPAATQPIPLAAEATTGALVAPPVDPAPTADGAPLIADDPTHLEPPAVPESTAPESSAGGQATDSTPLLDPPTGSPSPSPQIEASTAIVGHDDPTLSDIPEARPSSTDASDPAPTAPQPVIDTALSDPHETSGAATWLKEPVGVTARMLLIPIGAIVIVIVLLSGIAWYARGGYHVGALGDEVVVFKGRPGGILWFDPTLESRSGVLLIELTEDDRELVEDGHDVESLAGADAFLADLRTRTRPSIGDAGESDEPATDATGSDNETDGTGGDTTATTDGNAG